MKEFDKFLGLHALKTVRFYKALMCEFLATAILIISGCGGSVAMEAGKPPSTVAKAFTFGMTIAYIVWTFNHVSGTHFNPVVTFSFFINGHVSLIKAIGYITTQCVGAIAGAAVVWCLVPANWRGNLGSNVFADELTLAQVRPQSSCSESTHHGKDHTTSQDSSQGTSPKSCPSLQTCPRPGALMTMRSESHSQLTGCSMNPARSLGPAVVSGTWHNHWVYWTAPTIGGSVGSLLHKQVLAESPQGASHSIHVEARGASEENVSFMSKFTDKVIIVEAGDRVNIDDGRVGNPV